MASLTGSMAMNIGIEWRDAAINKRITLVITLLLFNLSYSVAQWMKVAAIPTDDIVALAVSGDTIFAASDTNLIYKSVDGGLTWNTIIVSGTPVNISALTVIGTNLYAGTYNNGIFSSTDNGLTWLNSVPNLLAVSFFESKGNYIYVATFGDGVYTSHRDSNSWKPMNDSLPTYSFNVNTILNTSNSLLIGAGANGTFYRFDYNTNSWKEEYYYGGLAPGLQIDKLINNGDTVFAVNGNRIIRSENDGVSWTDDKIGSHNGYGRTICAGTSLFYTLTNIISGDTWIQQRSKIAAVGTDWAVNEESVPGGYSYDLLEFKNKLFLARENGLYVKDLLGAGISNPLVNDKHVKIYTDPYNPSEINVLSDNRVDKITLFNVLGQISFSELIGKNEFTIQPDLEKGVYLANVKLVDGTSVVRKLILK